MTLYVKLTKHKPCCAWKSLTSLAPLAIRVHLGTNTSFPNFVVFFLSQRLTHSVLSRTNMPLSVLLKISLIWCFEMYNEMSY